MSYWSWVSIKGQGQSLTLVKGHSGFKVKCLTFGLYTQVSYSGPLGPLVSLMESPPPSLDMLHHLVTVLAVSSACQFLSVWLHLATFLLTCHSACLAVPSLNSFLCSIVQDVLWCKKLGWLWQAVLIPLTSLSKWYHVLKTLKTQFVTVKGTLILMCNRQVAHPNSGTFYCPQWN